METTVNYSAVDDSHSARLAKLRLCSPVVRDLREGLALSEESVKSLNAVRDRFQETLQRHDVVNKDLLTAHFFNYLMETRSILSQKPPHGLAREALHAFRSHGELANALNHVEIAGEYLSQLFENSQEVPPGVSSSPTTPDKYPSAQQFCSSTSVQILASLSIGKNRPSKSFWNNVAVCRISARGIGLVKMFPETQQAQDTEAMDSIIGSLFQFCGPRSAAILSIIGYECSGTTPFIILQPRSVASFGDYIKNVDTGIDDSPSPRDSVSSDMLKKDMLKKLTQVKDTLDSIKKAGWPFDRRYTAGCLDDAVMATTRILLPPIDIFTELDLEVDATPKSPEPVVDELISGHALLDDPAASLDIDLQARGDGPWEQVPRIYWSGAGVREFKWHNWLAPCFPSHPGIVGEVQRTLGDSKYSLQFEQAGSVQPELGEMEVVVANTHRGASVVTPHVLRITFDPGQDKVSSKPVLVHFKIWPKDPLVRGYGFYSRNMQWWGICHGKTPDNFILCTRTAGYVVITDWEDLTTRFNHSIHFYVHFDRHTGTAQKQDWSFSENVAEAVPVVLDELHLMNFTPPTELILGPFASNYVLLKTVHNDVDRAGLA
ncbi:hypothetical protein FRB99_008165 [Tulasnella sp. 403]|nr:hypothetical protein FRB99_008165 [Tulasnella sp. 403]